MQASGRGRNKPEVTWLPDPRSQLCSRQQRVPQFMALEIHFLFFLELFTSQFGHVYSACPRVHVCVHAHTLTLLCQGLMIPKELPYYILSFSGARITRYCLSYGFSHIMVTSPMFLIEQDTTAPVFSHFHPDGNSLPTTNTHEASCSHLSSLLEAETAQPG